MFEEDSIPTEGFVVLAKIGAAGRFHDEWRYHLANAGGRARCGALLNLREWHARTMSHLPVGLCERCARTIGKRTSRLTTGRSVPPAPADDQQLQLPLDPEEPQA